MRAALLLVAVGVSGGCASRPAAGPDLVADRATTTQTVQGMSGSTGLNLVNDASAVGSTINANVDVAWSALQSVYVTLEIPLSRRDNEKKVLGNSAFRTRRRVGSVPMIRAVDCGGESGMPNAETYDVTLEITSMLSPTPDGRTRLQTLVQGSARRPSSGNPNDVRCTSLGGLESKISEMVEKIVSGK